MSERKVTRRDFLISIGIGGIATSGIWLPPLLRKLLVDQDFSQSLDQLDESYNNIRTTSIAQEKNNSIEVPDIVKKAAVSILFNDEGDCSATNIYIDPSNSVSVFLTAKHCLPSNDILSLSVVQPHLTNPITITVPSKEIAIISDYEKDLALIAVNTSHSSIPWEPIEANPNYNFSNSSNNQFCALSFPVINGFQTPVGITASLDRTWIGTPSLSENKYQLEASTWFGASGAGVVDCQTSMVVGVISRLNLYDEGQAIIENLDPTLFNNIDQLISELDR